MFESEPFLNERTYVGELDHTIMRIKRSGEEVVHIAVRVADELDKNFCLIGLSLNGIKSRRKDWGIR